MAGIKPQKMEPRKRQVFDSAALLPVSQYLPFPPTPGHRRGSADLQLNSDSTAPATSAADSRDGPGEICFAALCKINGGEFTNLCCVPTENWNLSLSRHVCRTVNRYDESATACSARIILRGNMRAVSDEFFDLCSALCARFWVLKRNKKEVSQSETTYREIPAKSKKALAISENTIV